MNEIKQLSRLIMVLASVNTVAVQAEYHVVKPGDVLSVIAEQKRVQSGFLLSTEQIMLTLYKLNKGVFVGGDINQLVVASEMLIPDNTADYVQVSKAEAKQHLRDKGYLHSLHNAPAVEAGDVVTSAPKSPAPEYAQILEVLDSHQHIIEDLQVANKHLTTKFNLLERALGRVVLVQGLLTNDMVQVRKKMMDVAMPTSVQQEQTSVNDAGMLVLGNQRVELPELKSASGLTAGADVVAKTGLAEKPLPPVSQGAATAITHGHELPGTEDKAKLALPIGADGIVSKAPNVAEAHLALPVVEAKVLPAAAQNSVANVKPITPAVVPVAASVKASAIKRKVMPEQEDGYWVLGTTMIVGLFLAAFGAWRGVTFYKARVRKAAIQAADEAAVNPAVVPSSSAFNFNAFDDAALKDELSLPVKSIIEKSQKAVKDSGRGNEVDSVLDLLDMCLLCGDYEQAHKVTVKALADNKSSTVLANKLSFIERKMAKL